MATFSWTVGSGAFGTAGSWSPAGPPGSADTANFASTGGTISGTGSVNALNFQVGPTWTLSGAVQSNTISVADTLTVSGSLTSTAAATTAVYVLTVGNQASATGNLTVTGSSAVVDTGSNGASIGQSGTGTLLVSGGGTVRVASSNSNVISALASARGTGSSGTITVTGPNSALVANGYVYLGRAGTATLTVSAGGTFTGGAAGFSVTIGDGTTTLDSNGVPNTTINFGGTGTATVTGVGSLLHSLNGLRVGYRGSTGVLLVDAGAAARADSNIIIGGGTDRIGGTGMLTVQNGASVVSGGLHTISTAGIVFGNDAGTTGTGVVTGASSLLNANGDRLTVGGSGTGTLTITGGGRAISGSAGYSDVEAALAVAGGTGSTGTLTISGTGSQLTATGDGVIGGNERGAGPTTGGTGTVSVAGGGALSVSGTLTVEAAGSLTVDSSSTLTTPVIALNGGKATLGTLAGSTAVSFGAGGTLAVSAVSGSHAVSNFTFGDTIDLLGATSASLSGNTVTTSSGSLVLTAAPANTSYQLLSDGNGGTLVALTPKTIGVYRFFDSTFGTHFYTASAAEAQSVAAARSDLVPEGPGGVGLQAVAVTGSDPNAVAVYRFFDNIYGTHFFTADATERDTVIAGRPDLQYEPDSVFYEHATQQAGDTAVYRFFDSSKGTHFYTDDPAERASILANRSDLVAEGIGFYEPKQNYAS